MGKNKYLVVFWKLADPVPMLLQVCNGSSSLLDPGHWFVRISSSVHHSPLRKGLDDGDRDSLLLIDDGFYLHLTEGPIYETN